MKLPKVHLRSNDPSGTFTRTRCGLTLMGCHQAVVFPPGAGWDGALKVRKCKTCARLATPTWKDNQQ
jgi:hypothetical protein